MIIQENPLTQIILVRHGHVHNPGKIIYGRLPGYGLSRLGRQQIEVTAQHLAKHSITALYSSPLLRAVQTAEILLTYHPNVPLKQHQALNEVRFYYEGALMSDMEQRNWDLYTGVSEEYEQPPAIVLRVFPFLQYIADMYRGQNIVMVTHGDVIAFTVLALKGMPLKPEHKHTLNQLGLADDYPALGSMTTLSLGNDTRLENCDLSYVRPYGEELTDRGTSPK